MWNNSINNRSCQNGEDAYKDDQSFKWPLSKRVILLYLDLIPTRFKVESEEFRLINDDTVEAVVDDPRIYEYEDTQLKI